MNLPLIKIGITYTGSDEKQLNYINWLKLNAGVEIITLSPENANLELVRSLDGIVLTGGVDVHPKFYKSPVLNYLGAPDKFNEKRDIFEIAVFEISQQHKIPLLAICRGMQLVNCILGGSLVQDVGNISSAIHQFNKQDKAHGITIVSDTLLFSIIGVQRTVVNSAHHQAIDILAKGLKVNAVADDGIIEGIEWANKDAHSFLLGIQWHPERMFKFNLADASASKDINAFFVKEIIKSIKRKHENN